MTTFSFVFIPLLVLAASTIPADGPADNQAASVRPVPPPGIAIDADSRSSLQKELNALKDHIEDLRKSKSPTIGRYLPDVEVFSRAVELALNEDGFFEPKDIDRAKLVLQEGAKRASELKMETAPWTGLQGNSLIIVRGFRSNLDGTVQPYGVVRSRDMIPGIVSKGYRADIWCRGRSEKGLELQFIATRMTNPDPTPESGVIMIHPFGRYCNANKLAGETDTLEVLEHALKEYPIDPKRVAIRGFSMGGAAAWHLAVHYPDKWFAANPGAGFSETPQFLKVFQSEDLKPTWYEQKLWQMYDCPVWARNLSMLPTIAYSGEIDKQKQAADMMAEACWKLPEKERFELTHIIAPKTAHKVDPVARIEIERRLAILDGMRSKDPPSHVSFTTTTLRYNQVHWLTINALEEHWSPATVSATLNYNQAHLLGFPAAVSVGGQSMGVVELSVSNVTDLSLSFDANRFPHSLKAIDVKLDGETIRVARRSDLSWGVRLRKVGRSRGWQQVSPIEAASTRLNKKHGLQGPIDDAFMGPFLFVKPTGVGHHPKVDQWVEAEFNRAVREWHRQMRGDAIVKSSEELTPADFENYNLILWGDSRSNSTLAKLADQLPIQWNREQVVAGNRRFDALTHVPVMIFPNPLNPDRYVVLNSGFTYREYDYLNNARQIPKLPDWAIIDLSTPPDSRYPGKIVDADFFDEDWSLKPSHSSTKPSRSPTAR